MEDIRAHSLVTPEALAAMLGDPQLRIFDATFHVPVLGRDAHAEYLAAHLPGARFFDIDTIADHTTDLPHMLPPSDRFAEIVAALGVSNGDRIVVYDTYGMMTAARAWWMFRVFGHDEVAILDGGFPAWLAGGFPTASGEVESARGHFVSAFRPALVRDQTAVLAASADGLQIVDARPRERFSGAMPEPRAGLRRGHIPGSVNVPVSTLTDPATKAFLDDDALRARFSSAGVTPDRPVIATCGSGVTAAGVAFGLHLLGARDVSVYDGSFAQWGRPGDTPVESDV